MGRFSIIAEFWDFLRVRKKFWLLPLVMLFLLLAIFVVFTETSVLSPFIYILF